MEIFLWITWSLAERTRLSSLHLHSFRGRDWQATSFSTVIAWKPSYRWSVFIILILSPFFGHRLLHLGGEPLWSWSLTNTVLPMESSAIISLHLPLTIPWVSLGENRWVVSVAKKCFVASVFVITMLWLKQHIGLSRESRFKLKETQNLMTKLQKALVCWLNLADLTSFFRSMKSKWWGWPWASGGEMQAIWEDHTIQRLSLLYQLLIIQKRQPVSTHDDNGCLWLPLRLTKATESTW